MGQRNIILGCTCLFIVAVWCDDTAWKTFQARNQKVYKTEAEQQLRETIFNENLQVIEEHNKKYELGLVSYKLGVNKFADLTDKEFGDMFTALPVDENQLQGLEKYGSKRISAGEEPESIDWRDKSVVTEVKDQGNCGGCWAFSTTGTIESQLAINTGKLISLSEQQLLDCDTDYNKGCSGGVVQYALNYVRDNGLTLEEDYPYTAVQGSCEKGKITPAAYAGGYVNIIRNNETDLKQAVGLIGPVSVAIYSVPLKLYQTGIFDGACTENIDHGVLAVGYGTDNKTGTPYWIVKNSWVVFRGG